MVRSIFLAFILTWANGSVAQQVSAKAWIDHMKAMMPAEVCQEGMYFMACFNVTAQQCNEAMSEHTDACVEQYRAQIPETLQLPADGTRWGQVLGSCAGGRFEMQLLKEKVQSAKCNDPSQWM